MVKKALITPVLERWLVMAVIIDLMHYTSTAYYNRNRIPGYTGD